MVKAVTLILFFSVCSLWSQVDYKLIAESATKAKSGESTALRELYKQSLDPKNTSLRKYLVKTVALSMLKSSSKATTPYLKKVSSDFPDENLLEFLQLPPIQVDCRFCDAYGKKLKDCTQCKEGACRNCKGEGAVIYGNGKSRKESPCLSCKSSGHCEPCKGTGELVTNCRTCAGKGHVLNRGSFIKECARSIDLLLNKIYELDDDPATVFDVDFLKKDAVRAEQFIAAQKARAKQWRENEIIRCGLPKKRKQEKDKPGYITTVAEGVSESYEEGGSTSTLDHICLEISEYLKAQELKSKQKFLIKVYGQFLSDVPTVHVVVSENFTTASYDYKMRAGDGFYKFSALRAQANGYESIDFKVLDSAGVQLGGVNEKGFWINK